MTKNKNRHQLVSEQEVNEELQSLQARFFQNLETIPEDLSIDEEQVPIDESSSSGCCEYSISLAPTEFCFLLGQSGELTCDNEKKANVCVTDCDGNPVSDYAVSIAVIQNYEVVRVTPATARTDESGCAEFTVKGINPGKAQLETSIFTCGKTKKASATAEVYRVLMTVNRSEDTCDDFVWVRPQSTGVEGVEPEKTHRGVLDICLGGPANKTKTVKLRSQQNEVAGSKPGGIIGFEESSVELKTHTVYEGACGDSKEICIWGKAAAQKTFEQQLKKWTMIVAEIEGCDGKSKKPIGTADSAHLFADMNKDEELQGWEAWMQEGGDSRVFTFLESGSVLRTPTPNKEVDGEETTGGQFLSPVTAHYLSLIHI